MSDYAVTNPMEIVDLFEDGLVPLGDRRPEGGGVLAEGRRPNPPNA